MTKRILTGNQAVAVGALRSGVKVVTGYPGTPSTECVAHLLTLDLPDRHVEWSTNEKVACEIAAGAAWAGHRALCTMKMSGLNVAYDALISIAYSGTNGGLVIYVADDPGVSAGMPEQDSRGFALMAHLPMLEPSTPSEAYELVQTAFSLSEQTGAPVFLRLTTAVALAHCVLDTDDPVPPLIIESILEKDIARYTKAGSKICLDQHQALIDRLAHASRIVHDLQLNQLDLTEAAEGVGILSVGAVNAYLPEAVESLGGHPVSVLSARTTIPFPWEEASRLMSHCSRILVLEELEPHVERGVYVLAQQQGFHGKIVGKLDGTLSPLGEYGMGDVLRGLEACGLWPVGSGDERQPAQRSRQESAQPIPASNAESVAVLASTNGNGAIAGDEIAPAPRPITVCAGCPHRGTYLAIEAAVKQAGFSKHDVMVTGDIGCTILGMNPPFDLLWNEVSMGTSVSLAQGYVHAGVKTPVVATIGDSTFFHGGIPGLINAIQHRVPLTLVVMDNGWTSMTGMQVNAGTDGEFQSDGRRVDIEAVIRGLGPDDVRVVDPFDLEATTAAVLDGLRSDGVSVVLAQRECAIQAKRRGVMVVRTTIDPAKCVLCKRCLKITGCPALGISPPGEMVEDSLDRASDPSRGRHITIDAALCNGCGLCASFCPTGALSNLREPAGRPAAPSTSKESAS